MPEKPEQQRAKETPRCTFCATRAKVQRRRNFGGRPACGYCFEREIAYTGQSMGIVNRISHTRAPNNAPQIIDGTPVKSLGRTNREPARQHAATASNAKWLTTGKAMWGTNAVNSEGCAGYGEGRSNP